MSFGAVLAGELFAREEEEQRRRPQLGLRLRRACVHVLLPMHADGTGVWQGTIPCQHGLRGGESFVIMDGTFWRGLIHEESE